MTKRVFRHRLRSSFRGLAVAVLFGSLVLPRVTSQAASSLDRLLEPVVLDTKVAQADAAPTPASAAVVAPTPSPQVMLTQDILLGQLKKQIIDHFSINGEFDVDLSRSWTPVPIPSDDVTVSIIDYGGESLSSSMLIRFEVYCGGTKVGEWPVVLRAQLWKEIWVAAVRMDRGQPLDPSMLTTQKVDTLRERESYMTADTDLTGYEVSEAVGAGRPLTKREVAERPLIRKNQIVEAVARRGALAITMKAQALENGSANAVIKLRNLDSQKTFNAQVLDENRVEVQF